MDDLTAWAQEFMDEVEALTGYSLTMVTEISFVQDKYYDVNNQDKVNPDSPLLNWGENLDPNLNVNYARIDAKLPKVNKYSDNVNDYTNVGSIDFGKGFTGAFTVTNKQVTTVMDNMLVKVAPVDAVISADMISLINGEGENLNNFVEITSTPWSGSIVSSRSAGKTGLYNIGVQLKDNVDFEAFDKMVLPTPGDHNPDGCKGNHKYNMFAVAVTDTEKSRAVTSEYKVTLHVQKEHEATQINYQSTLEAISISDTKYSFNVISKYANGGAEDKGCAEIKSGSDFYINVNSVGGRVMASYVVIDMDNEALTTTDKVAINTLDIDGLEEVSKTRRHTLRISGPSAVAVPLKLVTIDYTGVVKYNIIWVKASEGVETISQFNIIPSTYVSTPTAWEASLITSKDLQEFTIPTGTTSCEVEWTIGEDNGSEGNIYNYSSKDKGTYNFDTNNDGKLDAGIITVGSDKVLQLYTADKKQAVAGTKLSDVAYAAFIGKLNLQAMREDTEYAGIIKFYNGDEYKGARQLTVKKTLPTDVPADFRAKTNSINNGVMTVYPKPQGTNTKKGNYVLSNSFINWAATDASGLGYGLVIDKITNVNPAKGTFDGIVTTPATPNIKDIAYDVLGDDKTYPSTVSYNYGEIKFIPAGHGVEVNAEHIVPWSTKFDMKFGYWPNDCVYSWSETPVVIYGKDQEILGKAISKDGKVTGYENVIKVLDPYKVEVNPFSGTTDWDIWAPNLLTSGTITLVTYDESGKKNENEFFTAEFDIKYGDPNSTMIKLTRNPSTTVLLRDNVETTVVINFTDKFGVQRSVPALKFIMKKNAE